jgi:uncharacterized protein YpuA (DUF1002 family)
LGLGQEKESEVINELTKITDQIQNNNPDWGAIKQSLKTVRNVLEGVTGSLIVSGLVFEIGKFLS